MARSPSTRLAHLRDMPLEPWDYCQRWFGSQPGKSHRKAYINLLVEATGLSPGTIRNWGPQFQRRPAYVLYLLRQVDLLNQLEALEQQGQWSLPADWLHE